jgi:hypothetical protein
VVAIEVAVAVRAIAVIHRRTEDAGLGIALALRLTKFLAAAAKTLALSAAFKSAARAGLCLLRGLRL